MQGLHLTADLHGCGCPLTLLTQAKSLAELCRAQTREAGLTVVADRWHRFPDHGGAPGGVTGTLLLAESHLAVHTWPERLAVTLDVYVCNFTGDNTHKAKALLESLLRAFAPRRTHRQQLERGGEGGALAEGELVLEWLNRDSAYGFRFERRLLDKHTSFQHMELLESRQLGRTLRLDGRFMTSEGDEFFYHEALVQPAATAHPNPRRVLILGGGDGGAAEEVLKHPCVERVVVVDLDAEVVELARQELLFINRGSLDDARVHVRCEDGFAFIDATPERFDLVLLDLTDPETPAAPLYTRAFLAKLRRVLMPGGAVVLHLGAPFHEKEQVRSLALSLAAVYSRFSAYGLHVPLYGAYWGFAVASDTLAPATLSTQEVRDRLEERQIGDLQYYNAEVHGALFALPNFYGDIVRS